MAATRTVDGARELAAALDEGAARINMMMGLVVEKSTVDLTTLTQQNASHRPGPNAPTGDYRGSWEPRQEQDTGEVVSWSTGTNRPQARRLEYGFVGPDSLGRVYHHAPLPHHGPAVDVIEPIFHAAMEKVAEQAISW